MYPIPNIRIVYNRMGQAGSHASRQQNRHAYIDLDLWLVRTASGTGRRTATMTARALTSGPGSMKLCFNIIVFFKQQREQTVLAWEGVCIHTRRQSYRQAVILKVIFRKEVMVHRVGTDSTQAPPRVISLSKPYSGNTIC